MSWLSKKWEELSAQVNMRDGGKTASTVRANRQPVQPAQTKTPPKQNLWDRAVDVVSANTPADNYRRQQQQVDTTGTDEAMRMLQKQALSGQIDKNVAAAKIRALGTSDVQTNTAENVLKPTTPAQIAGQTVVDVAMNRKVAPVALGTGRSAAGTVEGVGGLYDLASPGDGVNRFSKVGVNAGQATDQAVKDNNYNELAYKGSQAATDVAQYAIGAGGVKAVGKATTTLPYVPKVVSFADRVAQPLTKPISGAVERGATNLAQKGFTGRVASKTLQNVTNPGYQAVNAGFTALQAGKEASHGTEVSPIGVTTNLVAGGVGFPLAGAVGGEVARPIVNKAVSGLRKTNLVRPSNLKPGEVADLARMNEIAKTGAILDDNIYQRGVYAAQKAGIDHRDANQVDTLLGAHRNHDTLVQQRKQAIQDAKARVTRNPQTLLEPEGGYARIPVGKNDPAPDLSIEQKTLINDYAEMLQGMDDGNGVTILPDGSRASSNSQFYRKVFAEKGRAPSKADWFDEARRQIESGKAGFGASDDYKLLPSKDIGAVGKNVDPLESLKQEARTVEKFGWKSVTTPQGTKLINRNGKHVATITEKKGRYTASYNDGRRIATGTDANKLAEDVARKTFYAQEIPQNTGGTLRPDKTPEPYKNPAIQGETTLERARSVSERVGATKKQIEAQNSAAPKEAYHSTASLEIEGGKLRASKDGAMGEGVYLHTNKDTARLHGAMQGDGNVADQNALKVKINTNNIYRLTDNNYPSPEQVNIIKKYGHDGIMLKDGEMVIFDPKKVELSQPPKSPPKKATDAEPPDFLKPTNAKGVIIKESKPQPDGTKIVVRATKNPETGKLQQFEERVDKNTDLPKAYEEPQVTERLAEYGKQAPEPRAPVTEVKGQAKKDLHESTNKFLGGYAGDKARNMGVARSLPKMNDEGSISIIDQIESGGDNSGLPTQIRAILDAKHKELKDAGVDIGYLQNYFPHRWVNEDKVKRAYQAVKLRASIQNERELPTVKEGIALGYKPKTKDYREAISDYLNTADKLLRNRTYFNELQKKNLILESYQPIPDMQVIDAPGLPKPRPHIDEVNGIEQQGNYYASPEVAKSLNRLFGDRKPHGAYEKTLDATAYVSRFLQDVGLAGGIPGTPLNAFTFAQVTKELLSGSIKNPIVATMKSFTKEGYRKYADQNNEAVQALQRQGIKIRDDYNFKNLGDEFTSMVEQEGGKKNMFAKGWDKVFSDPTFKRFMPSLQIEMFKKVQKGALKRGKTPEEAEKLAGDAVANFYGLNRLAKESFRSKPGTDAATTILFAPKYRESMINFLIVNNAKALNPAKWGAREYRQNQKFMVGAALMFAGENYANEYLNGVPMYKNPDGKKDKLIIPADRIPGKPTNGKDIAIPFLPSIATVPRYAGSAAYNLARGNTEQATKDASGFLSFGLRPLVDTFVTNENYFGDKIVEDGATPLDAAKQRGGYLLSQYQHPYIREAIRTKQGKNKSAFEAISKASEAPLRFYNPDTYRYDDKFVPKGPKGEKFTFSEQRDRAKTKKEIDGIADNLGLSKRQKADFASLSAVEFNEDGTLKEDNNPFYKSQRFTKLQDDGVFEAMKKKAQLNAKLNGKPVDPIFNLDGEARRLVLWKKTLPPGTSDPSVKKLYEQDWYQEFRKAEDKYYTSKKDWNTKMGYANQPEDKSYPVASKQIEEAQNAYFKLPKGTGQRSAFIRNNPDVWNKMTAFWEAKDQWTNGERSKLGLGPVDEPATTGGYAYGKSGGKGKGKNKSNFDYSKNLFGSNGTSSTSVSSNLRKILAKAMKS